ncbi:MAG: prepilin-type N-terminal cleavage/methylation domain-containing protein [Clostridiales bacterium]|nr:prepilin-type N-terminal cleavage/methylation domain-containing protein [Clostridiales bacterium]MCF8021153.1 prepilin-type N-terminal cleavage/methylation domain-containing protein [Clostridiales bacterium]
MLNQKGYLLLEVLVACLLLSLFLVPAADIFFYNHKAVQEARCSDIALNLARARLEMSKEGLNKSLFERYPGYQCSVDTEEINECLKSITVTVSYEVSDKEHEISLSALEAISD